VAPSQNSDSFGLKIEEQDPADAARRVMEFAKGLLEAAGQVQIGLEAK